MRTKPFLIVACTALLIVSCKKNDCDKPPTHNSSCDLMQVIEASGPKEEPVSRYRKEYDPSTGKASKVVVGLFQFGLVDSVSLIPKYNGDAIYYLSEGHAGDTVITASFDNAGRLLKLTQGNTPNERLASMVFSYALGKLSNLHFDFGDFTIDLVPSYDSHGNVTQLIDSTGEHEKFYYTYDLSVEATRQFYSDEFVGDGYNSFYFAEFMGWLPDLEPVNKRIHSRVLAGDYELSDTDLTGHIYDADGKLLSYQSGAFTNIWKCDSQTDESGNNHHHHN